MRVPQASFHVLQFTALLYKGAPKHFSVPLCNQAGSAAGTTALKSLKLHDLKKYSGIWAKMDSPEKTWFEFTAEQYCR